MLKTIIMPIVMRKLIASFLSCFLLLFTTPVLAQPNNNAQIPERNGDYADPDHPGVRVRVFVHEPRPAKPSTGSATSPVLVFVCPSDNPSSAVVPPTGWHLPSNWTYTLNTASVPSSVGSANLPTIASNAFSQWTSALGGKVNITRTPFDTTVNRASFDGIHVIAWGRTSGTALGVTYTWYYTATHEVAEVDTIMNQKFPWYWNAANPACTDANSYDAQDILTHELGHWMGLNDTYDAIFSNNTMFGYGSKGEIKKDTLTTGDINGVKAIYP